MHAIYCPNTSLETGTVFIESASKHRWVPGQECLNITDICTSQCSHLLNLSQNAINSILPLCEELLYNTIYCISTTAGTGSIILVPKGCKTHMIVSIVQ